GAGHLSSLVQASGAERDRSGHAAAEAGVAFDEVGIADALGEGADGEPEHLAQGGAEVGAEALAVLDGADGGDEDALGLVRIVAIADEAEPFDPGGDGEVGELEVGAGPQRGAVGAQRRAERAAAVGHAGGEQPVLLGDPAGVLELHEEAAQRAEAQVAQLDAEEVIGVVLEGVEEGLPGVLEGDLVIEARAAELGDADGEVEGEAVVLGGADALLGPAEVLEDEAGEAAVVGGALAAQHEHARAAELDAVPEVELGAGEVEQGAVEAL